MMKMVRCLELQLQAIYNTYFTLYCLIDFHVWSSGQSSWLQIQRSGFDSRATRFSWVLVGLERGPLIFVSTVEELLGRNNSGPCLENREYGRGDPSRWPRDTLYSQKLALTSPTSGGRSVVIVRSQTKATELLIFNSLEFKALRQ
jgi:hypothetical protein